MPKPNCLDAYWDAHPQEVGLDELNNIAAKFPGGSERPMAQKIGMMDDVDTSDLHSKLYQSMTLRQFYEKLDAAAELEGWVNGQVVESDNIKNLAPPVQKIILSTYRRLRSEGFNHTDLIE